MPSTDCPRKQCILGVGISATGYSEVADLCRVWIEERRTSHVAHSQAGRYICVTSVHGIMLAFMNRAVRDSLNGAHIATPDGMPVVWAMRSFGAGSQQRVYGPELMVALCAQAERLGHKIFLYGGREDTLQLLCARLRARFPKLLIAGAISPKFRPLTPAEDAGAACRIRESGADLVFVGMSTPKQDRWMADHSRSLGSAVLVGVGAAFDFHAGKVRQAPAWMQERGLEWFFRLLMEPRRLWKRYILVTPLFLPLWGLQKAGLVRFLQPSPDPYK